MAKKQANICVIPGGLDSDWLQLPADAFARLKRLLGWEVNLLLSSGEFARVFKIGYAGEDFAGPETVISHLIMRLQQAGAVYKRTSQFAVCETCGMPEPQSQQCSKCGGNIIRAEREGYYFRVQRYHEKILELSAEEDLVLPPYQQGYVLNSLSNMSSEDVLIALKVSRAKQKFLPAHWFSALAAILSGCGYPGDEGGFQRLWASTYLFIPREKLNYIYYWCGVLLALHLPGPGGFICHSSLKILDRRQQEVSLLLLAQNYGQESIRYLLLAIKATPGENVFSEDQVIQRINHDLANELGNLVARIISMVSRYAGEMVPPPNILTRQNADLELRERALETPGKVEQYINSQELFQAIRAVKNLIGATNRFIVSTAPWQLATGGNQQERLNTVLYNICEALRFIAVTLKPIMPEAAQSILGQLGIDSIPSLSAWSSLGQWGLLPVDTKILPQPALFPRIVSGYGGIGPEQDLILREDLARINMVVARVLSAGAVTEYEGLLHLILYDGRQRYSALAPVARSAPPAALEGKKVVLLSNLRPTEVEGMLSEGEVLVLETETGNLKLVFVDDDIPEGSKVLCLS
jgi:methionyl-tRNA synthetase